MTLPTPASTMPTATSAGVNSPHGPANPATQRLNMVESQVRPSDVTDRRIIRAMGLVPREAFVPVHLKSVAYMDEAVPLAASPMGGRAARQMLAPRTLAKLIQEANLEAGAIVLDVGCATGYSTAVLARIVRKVVGLEVDPGLAAAATAALQAQAVSNASIATGPLAAGHAVDGPYDAILVNGAVTAAPQRLLEQLKDGGRLIAIQQAGPAGKAVVWTRVGGIYDSREVFDVGGMVLPGFERAAAFSL